MNTKFLNIVFSIGAILVLISSVLVMEHVAWGKYSFAIGVGLFILSRSKMIYVGNDARLKRLNRPYFFSSILLVIAAILIFREIGLWIVLLLITALNEFYVSMRYSVYEKENAEAAKNKESQSASNSSSANKSIEE